MGVKGLLPCLQSITRAVPLERYRGLAVAIDAMSWLHKGIFACNVRALAKSQRSNSATTSSEELDCVKYTIKKAEILRQKFGIDVLLVIDGDSLPSKKEENEQRRVERDKAFERAVAADYVGDNRTARRLYARSCSITYNIRYELIKACKQASISFLVAPYEADAQMAGLSHTNMVDLVITEDSDILAYGCPRALFKIDFDTFQGQEIQLMKDIGENDTLSFRNWTHDMFVFMCIISGCDYCKGVPGIGIKLAHKIVRVHRTPAKIFNALRSAGRMPHDFEKTFWIAFRTFRHQRVFCLSKGLVEPLWPISGSKQKSDDNYMWPFLGNHIESNTARKIAEGSLHPCKKIPWSEVTDPVVGSDSINKRTLESHLRHPILSPQVKRAAPRESQSSHGKENTSNAALQKKQGKEMFSFFSKSNKRANNDILQNNQPPLREIYFVGNDGNGSTSESKHRPVPPRNHLDIPIHFHEYYSRLVGGSFKPLSRKRTKPDNVGTKSSKFVQRILQKSSEIQGLNDILKESRSVYGNGQTDFSENHGRNQLTEGECDNVRTSEYEQNHGFDKFRRQTVPPQDKASTSSRGIENSVQLVESENFGASSYSTNPGLLLKDDNFLYLEEANSQRQCSYDLCQSQYEQYQTHGSFVNEHHSNVNFSLSVQYMDCFDTNFGCNDETDSGNNAFPLNDDCCDREAYGGSAIDYEFGGKNDIGSFQQLQDEQHHRTGCFDDDFKNIESTFQSFGNEFRINTNADYHGQKVSEGIFDEVLLNTFDSLQKL